MDALRPRRYAAGNSNSRTWHLISLELDLEVLGRLLRDPAAKVELVDLAHFVPERGLVVQDELLVHGRGLARRKHLLLVDLAVTLLQLRRNCAGSS